VCGGHSLGQGHCSVKSHKIKSPLQESLTRFPKDNFLFLGGVSKGYGTLLESLLKLMNPPPAKDTREWVVALLDGLAMTKSDASANFVQELLHK
jgi:hypothetical protein